MAETLDKNDDSDDDDAPEHKCDMCEENFKEKGGYYNLYYDKPICYECYEEEFNNN
jgi:hypothetical protein